MTELNTAWHTPGFLMLAILADKHYISFVAATSSNWSRQIGMKMEDLIKAKDLAKALSVNVETVRRWTRSGTLPHVVIGQSKRYSLPQVLAALKAK